MKKLLFTSLLGIPLFAGIAVHYDPNSSGVTNRVTRIETSVPPSRYEGQSNVLVFTEPPYPDVLTNAASLLKFDGEGIALLAANEQEAVQQARDAEIAAQQAEFLSRYAAESKTNAIASVEGGFDPDGRILKAFAEIVMNEINILRGQLQLARTNVSAFQSATNRNNVPLSDRTLAQLKNAIVSKLQEQSDAAD